MSAKRQKSDAPIAVKAVGVFFVLLVSLSLAGCGGSQEQVKDRQVKELRIKTSDKEHVFSVELSLDEASQTKGLMFRREMDDTHGMLFVYQFERRIGMWMKNTFLPLDMLFLKKDGKIAKIARNTEPFSTDIISSDVPITAVLELKAGTSDRLSINVGDWVLHPLLVSE